MSPIAHATLAILIAVQIIGGARAGEAQSETAAASQACAKSAAHPQETGLGAPGVAMDDIDITTASPVCQAAAEQPAASPADHYRYARVLYKMQAWDRELKELTLAAASDNALAQHLLGDQYLRGDGVPADATAAAQWLTKAAMQRVPPAMYFIGVMFRDGNSALPRHIPRALELIRNAATVGLAEAQLDLGTYFLQQGNLPTALQYFAAAAQQGDAAGMTALADLQWNGQGTTADRPAAMRNYRRAAALGNTTAKAKLAEMSQSDTPQETLDDDGPGGAPRSLTRAEQSNERTWR